MKKTLLLSSALLVTCMSLKAQNVFTAIESNDALAVKFLLNNSKFDVNAKDAAGNTALIEAVKKGQDRIVKLLLQKDANIDIKDNNGNTALILACANKNTEELYYMASHYPDLNIKNNKGETALMTASSLGDATAVKVLLAYGAKASIKDNDGKSAIDYASNTETVSLLNEPVVANLEETVK